MDNDKKSQTVVNNLKLVNFKHEVLVTVKNFIDFANSTRERRVDCEDSREI